jgi:hypothetical protein
LDRHLDQAPLMSATVICRFGQFRRQTQWPIILAIPETI